MWYDNPEGKGSVQGSGTGPWDSSRGPVPDPEPTLWELSRGPVVYSIILYSCNIWTVAICTTVVLIRILIGTNPYLHDRRANKDSYPHDSNNQCIILWLQLSFVVINVQLILVLLISFYSLIFARFCNKYVLILLFLFVNIIMLKILKWSSYYFTWILLLEILHFLPYIDR